jgi:hypothetical protein
MLLNWVGRFFLTTSIRYGWLVQERELSFDIAKNNIYMSLNLSFVKGIYKMKSLTVFELAASEAWLNCFYSIII